MFTEEKYAHLYFSHGDNISKDDSEKLNDWLEKYGVEFIITSDEDGVSMKFIEV